jgi:cbb3-type cytochrome oxidase cytochrome c subunit
MKGIVPLFLGIFGTFAFSWAGLILLPNYQIGHLDPQMDEEGNDPYPAPKSGMADRGRKIYAANGCVYCHSQQVRADYAASDIDRKWGERRSAPRDYLFERPIVLGKMRVGPDLSNIGKRAPVEEENAPPAASASPNPAGSAPPQTSPGTHAAPGASPSTPPAAPASGPQATSSATASPTVSSATVAAVSSPATSSPAATAASPNPAATTATNAGATAATNGTPPPYTASWHHRHLYSPRSLVLDSNMPAYHFLYEKRRISGERAADALKLGEADAAPEGWEVVPTYDAKCLVAYLMSLDQSHALKEVKAAAAAPAAASPAPAPTKEAK